MQLLSIVDDIVKQTLILNRLSVVLHRSEWDLHEINQICGQLAHEHALRVEVLRDSLAILAGSVEEAARATPETA
jgi:hypothetical protein